MIASEEVAEAVGQGLEGLWQDAAVLLPVCLAAGFLLFAIPVLIRYGKRIMLEGFDGGASADLSSRSEYDRHMYDKYRDD